MSALFLTEQSMERRTIFPRNLYQHFLTLWSGAMSMNAELFQNMCQSKKVTMVKRKASLYHSQDPPLPHLYVMGKSEKSKLHVYLRRYMLVICWFTVFTRKINQYNSEVISLLNTVKVIILYLTFGADSHSFNNLRCLGLTYVSDS